MFFTRRQMLSRTMALGATSLAPSRLFSQSLNTGAQRDSSDIVPTPAKNPYPYSGVSGPGFPLNSQSGHGGWRSGSSGLAYQGEHPPSFATLPWDNCATGSAVTQDLIPSLMPLLEVQVRDTIVCRGGDDGYFYMTGSTCQNIWAFNDGVELWKSKDLKKWKYLGLVWSLDKDGTWEKQWRSLHGKPCRAIWAPELHYLRGDYYICLNMAPGGISILKSTTGKPTGPYTHAFFPEKPIAGGIDPTLFEDDDHKVTSPTAQLHASSVSRTTSRDSPKTSIPLSSPIRTTSLRTIPRDALAAARVIWEPKGRFSSKPMAVIILAQQMTTKAVTRHVLQCRQCPRAVSYAPRVGSLRRRHGLLSGPSWRMVEQLFRQ